MSDYSEYYEFYKKHWEKALSEKTEKVNLRITELEAEITQLENKVESLKASLEMVRTWGDRIVSRATDALQEISTVRDD